MVTLLAAGLVASFAGGDVAGLARTISEATKQPVVFEAGARETAPAFQFETDDLNLMSRDVLEATGLRRAPGALHAFHHGRLGAWNFGLSQVARLTNHNVWRASAKNLPEGFLKDGNVTLQSKSGESLTLNTLPRNLLAKPLQVHWLLGDVSFKAWVENLPVQDFLNCVAKSVGGRLLQQQNRFLLDIDSSEVQRRALATLAEALSNKAASKLAIRDRFELELSRSGLSSLNSGQVSTLLATNGGRVQFEITPSMRPAIFAYVTALLDGTATEGEANAERERAELVSNASPPLPTAENQSQPQREARLQPLIAQRRNRTSNQRLASIDPRILGLATIDARFRVSVELATIRDRLGRQGAPVQLP